MMKRTLLLKYSPKGLWTLFLVASVPVHFWTIILFLLDFSWIAERTNPWDAIGVGAYALLIALTEGVLIFAGALGLGFLIQPPWDEERRIQTLSVLIVVSSLWAMLGQLYFLLGISLPESFFIFMAGTDNPLRILYLSTLILVVPSIFFPVYFLFKSQRMSGVVNNLIERLTLLMIVYLFLDVAGLVIVIIRNL